ncbi:hypothetical protein MUN81_11910 [Hymenobacter sp. 5317J-9]|uniref:hypothetical protein n=1 Tax=Hymenobacter sp. 5317J-9 TaxID=2932250 RepID=UPI001FD71151|nr:hypothetical protein [Hymenobacter sp. 5317J-9]UOQ95968.1 hypothetical protein MUN81_11910 [Hymenobacter sp. 5317J-9]
MKRHAVYLLLLLALSGAVGNTLYRQHRAQRQLNAQLLEMSDLLLSENADAEQAAEGTVKSIHAAVQKNQNKPAELAVLAEAENLNIRADSLVHTLRAHTEKLLLATHNPGVLLNLSHANETEAVAQQLGSQHPAYLNLRQQLAALTDTLRKLHPHTTQRLKAPTFEGQTLAVAMATLAELESEVRTAEAIALRHLAAQIGASRMAEGQVALASAESNMVAPGELYRARLIWSKVLKPRPAGLQMRCNGQLIPVGADMIGRVRLVAARRPGPATWTGTIRFNQNGRDTTFQVRVPYRVVRR